MYTYRENHGNLQTIFIVDRISQFGEQDIKKLTRCSSGSFHVVIPTLKDLEDIPTTKYDCVRIMEIYDSKAMFCQLFLAVLQDEELAAYFPKEALQLINDYDYYPISYSEGARRLKYLINVLHIKNIRHKPVRFKEMTEKLVELLTAEQRESQELKVE